MIPNQLFVAILILIILIVLAYFVKSKILKLCYLIILPFIMSYVFYKNYQGNILTINTIIIYACFAILLIYNAVKFYNKYLKDFEE
jgi:hypothetical protein